MAPEAPAFLVALKQSGVGVAIRQPVWIYPAARFPAHVGAGAAISLGAWLLVAALGRGIAYC